MKLHEMKIGELIETFAYGDYDYVGEGDEPRNKIIYPEKLKQWAISIVKNCDNTQNFATNNRCGTIDGYEPKEYVKMVKWEIKNPFKLIGFCNICQFIIDRFELKEEDLHG